MSPDRQSASEFDIARDMWQVRGQPRIALDHALKAVELWDENADAEHLTALIYMDLCRYGDSDCRFDEAEKHARRALKINPEFREARNTLGVILIHSHKPRQAIVELKVLTQDLLYRSPELAWGNLGQAYYDLKQYDEAIEALRRAVGAQPGFCVGYYRLGEAYFAKGDNSSALTAYTNAIESDDARCQTVQETYLGRAKVLVELGQSSDALPDLDECVQLDATTETGRLCSILADKLQ